MHPITTLFYLNNADKENGLVACCSSSINIQGMVGRKREGVVLLNNIPIPKYIFTFDGGMLAPHVLSSLYKWVVECPWARCNFWVILIG